MSRSIRVCSRRSGPTTFRTLRIFFGFAGSCSSSSSHHRSGVSATFSSVLTSTPRRCARCFTCRMRSMAKWHPCGVGRQANQAASAKPSPIQPSACAGPSATSRHPHEGTKPAHTSPRSRVLEIAPADWRRHGLVVLDVAEMDIGNVQLLGGGPLSQAERFSQMSCCLA